MTEETLIDDQLTEWLFERHGTPEEIRKRILNSMGIHKEYFKKDCSTRNTAQAMLGHYWGK